MMYYVLRFLVIAALSLTTLTDITARDFSKSRPLNYTPDGDSFVCVNGSNKFNRALYGMYSGFRLETSDMPEFALYLPGMGGNLTFSVVCNGRSIELNDAENIESRYTAGRRDYTITDKRFGGGVIKISALVMRRDFDGAFLEVTTEGFSKDSYICWTFGGVSGKVFMRNGDIGRDAPDSFALKPEYLDGNTINIDGSIAFVSSPKGDRVTAVFPADAALTRDNRPVLNGRAEIGAKAKSTYMAFMPKKSPVVKSEQIPSLFAQAESDRAQLASTISISTPDKFLNPIGGNLAVAAEGVWGGKAWLHGAIGWRESCLGWRAAYLGDILGWHERSRTHFNTYRDMQIRDVEPVFAHPAQDSALNIARSKQQWGTQMYSNGYICSYVERPRTMSFYDMNLVYVDELLWHFRRTGDVDYVREMWPTITLHLAWEKRNFDPDDDGLYDAYCCIWASDALYYNGGGVTHSSAYNYRANKSAAELAQLIGEDPKPYAEEAKKILTALNKTLWIAENGHWAEYKDLMGHKRLHESAALWTIYHSIDSQTATPFQAYEATRYVDTRIPHIPVLIDGSDEKLYEVSTTDWSPYAWSINNVAMPETTHTALAYWQAGRPDEAYSLLKAAVMNYMYLGLSPANFGLNSYYDRHTNQVYRDFADPIGTTSRAVAEGLFGIVPDLLRGELTVKPGFPTDWNCAEFSTSDIRFSFNRNGRRDKYNLSQSMPPKAALKLIVAAQSPDIVSATVNGKKAKYRFTNDNVGYPTVEVDAGTDDSYTIEITWGNKKIDTNVKEISASKGDILNIDMSYSSLAIHDQQGVLAAASLKEHTVSGCVAGVSGGRTMFVKQRCGNAEWWQPIHINIAKEPKAYPTQFADVVSGKCVMINFDNMLNDSVSRIFRNEYLSPRSPYTTLQITKYGAGEWCRPLEIPAIDDSGLRRVVRNDTFKSSIGVPFRTFAEGRNVLFSSLWDNFADSVSIPLYGQGRNLYLLMAGSTNHMQSHMVNGVITITYTDGTTQRTELINPENWYTIDQDAFEDGYAFRRESPKPYRVLLSNGIVTQNPQEHVKLEGLYGHTIPDGAALMLDIPINADKKLSTMTIETISNDVIIGVMAVTLQQ